MTSPFDLWSYSNQNHKKIIVIIKAKCTLIYWVIMYCALSLVPEVINQTQKTVFKHNFKHQEDNWKYDMQRSAFNKPWGDWKWSHSLSRVFDISSQSKLKLRRERWNRIAYKYSLCTVRSHSTEFLIILGHNYSGAQVTQWDFQNKGRSGWTGTSSFVWPLSIINSVPCDQIVQKAHSLAATVMICFVWTWWTINEFESSRWYFSLSFITGRHWSDRSPRKPRKRRQKGAYLAA